MLIISVSLRMRTVKAKRNDNSVFCISASPFFHSRHGNKRMNKSRGKKVYTETAAMDYTTDHQKYQQYYQQYQPQAAAEASDPSQMQAYYAYNQPQQQQYQYYSSTSYPQQFHQEATSIHPPGVPILPDPTHFQNQQNAYYSGQSQQQSNLSQFSGNNDATQRSTHPRVGQSPYRGGGRKGGRPFRGAARGRGPRPDGRGRGQGHGRHLPLQGAASNSAPSTSVPGQTPPTVPAQAPAATWPPPRMAWCELCRVDCNTPEILEQHKNGKRHKKNLQVNAELQNLNNKLKTEQQNVQIPNSGSQSEDNQPEKIEKSGGKQPQQQCLPSQAVADNNSMETELHKDAVDKPEVHTVDSVAEPQRKSRVQFDGRGHGFKRKMRGGRGGKYMRTNEGPRRPVEPPKPKEVIPFICELCNVKCESQVVFDSHLAGKKHLANVKRFDGHRALYGEAAIQALYPPNFTSPSSSVIPQVQQGVSDPQVVLAQLLTYVLSQTQAQGLLAAQVPALLAAQASGVPAVMAPTPPPASGSSQETRHQQNFQNQGSLAISEAGSKDTVTAECEGQQQSITTDSEAPEPASVDANSENLSEEKNASSSRDNLITSKSEKPVINAEQVVCATASGTAAPISKCEVASADQAGNDLNNSVLEKENEDPGSEIEKDQVGNAEQVVCATASEIAAPLSKREVASSDQAGNYLNDSVLVKENEDPGSEIEEDPEEDLQEQEANK